ncbi:hypothetical protein [Enterococcus wangshanyuanii]|uniref:CxxH/CxxC protein n=1 Tax=Enterococcus wangshanyuanii TaxID=2005703 RepID=A0ABQ1PJ97_9ENTE|nr:hypothetical protein [Enterococcus wangshanyuanii]GGC98199.1 hypothetical protein GCM10011573_29660 [Enterococcus wangshanyuanii]
MCQYCQGEYFNRPIYDTDYIKAFIEDESNVLVIDDDFVTSSVEINYCPMCGRKLEIEGNE